MYTLYIIRNNWVVCLGRSGYKTCIELARKFRQDGYQVKMVPV